MRSVVLLALLAGALAAVWYAEHTGLIEIPGRWKPWVPLDITDEPNFLTRYKLARLSADAAACNAVLEKSGVRYAAVPDRASDTGCAYENAVRVAALGARVGEPFTLTCRSAVSLALWERHVLQPAALRHYGERVARLEHYGSYACRNIYGREGGRRSRHANAEALDIAGMVLENGKRVRVAADWSDGGVDGQFLRDAHNGACRFFDSVLGPDYNAAHRDHFHFDRGPARICR